MKQAQRTSYWRLSTYFQQEIKKTKMLWKTSNDPCWHLVFRQKTWYEVKNLFIPVLPHMIDYWPGQTIESSAGMQQVVIISTQKLKTKIPPEQIPLFIGHRQTCMTTVHGRGGGRAPGVETRCWQNFVLEVQRTILGLCLLVQVLLIRQSSSFSR